MSERVTPIKDLTLNDFRKTKGFCLGSLYVSKDHSMKGNI